VIESAAVHFVCEATSERPPAVVWKHLSDIEAWPSWVPGTAAASLDGALLPGAGFRWRARGLWIRSTLLEVERPRRLSWQGRGGGLKVEHRWTIEPHPSGSLVRSEEWADGFWLRPFADRIGRSMQRAVEAWLDALIRRARQEARCD
jgi:uncharacterized protein YndB with AHSA1/START domain